MELNCQAIEKELEGVEGAGAKIRRALHLWAVKSFEHIQNSTEARELMESGLEFARDAFEGGYARFEKILAGHLPTNRELSPAAMAHLLSSAVRGFKQVAASAADLEDMIAGLLKLSGL